MGSCVSQEPVCRQRLSGRPISAKDELSHDSVTLSGYSYWGCKGAICRPSETLNAEHGRPKRKGREEGFKFNKRMAGNTA